MIHSDLWVWFVNCDNCLTDDIMNRNTEDRDEWSKIIFYKLNSNSTEILMCVYISPMLFQIMAPHLLECDAAIQRITMYESAH
jgi:hypothetical protein